MINPNDIYYYSLMINLYALSMLSSGISAIVFLCTMPLVIDGDCKKIVSIISVVVMICSVIAMAVLPNEQVLKEMLITKYVSSNATYEQIKSFLEMLEDVTK